MKTTWRTLLWEYGFLIYIAAIPITVVCWFLEFGCGMRGLGAVVATLFVVPITAYIWIAYKYPIRSDLPEWKEYAERVKSA